MNHLHRQILGLTLPSVISNITVPLLGIVDSTIVGHMGSAVYIGTVAVGGSIFSMIYWVFAFLRMGTTGLTAQARGQEDAAQMRQILRKALTIASILGVLLIILQIPILQLGQLLMQPDDATCMELHTYFSICIWGAPAVMVQYCLSGWFIGAQDTRSPMLVAIFQNIMNILISLLLVYALHWKIAGVATGTLAAEWLATLLSVCLLRSHKEMRQSDTNMLTSVPWGRFFRVNIDIFLRTLCLVLVTVYFTRAGSGQGPVVLAANALLMQFFLIYSYVTDGLANAAEALSGKCAGNQNRIQLQEVIKAVFLWGMGIALCFTLCYGLGGNWLLRFFTDVSEVYETALQYKSWVIAIPVLAILAIVWDGVFIGLTYTKGMLLSMFTAMLVFFGCWFSLRNEWQNHALWLAFVAYLTTRGLMQTILFRQRINKI